MNLDTPPLSGPLHIDYIHVDAAGAIGMTHCPGRSTMDARGRLWKRDLHQDVDAICRAGFGTVVTLLENDELIAFGAGTLGARLQDAGLQWLQFPIADFGVPAPHEHPAWRSILSNLVVRLQAGERVLVHCAAGFGRTGSMVATVLKALGQDSESAIVRVRSARPGTIETSTQYAFVVEFETSSGQVRRR